MGVTKIEWTSTTRPDGSVIPGFTFNPWIGCQKVSEACKNCYAENETFVRVARSNGRELWGPNAERHVTSESYWKQPLKWNREAAEPCFLCGDVAPACQCGNKKRYRVFCASLADVFEAREELIEPRSRLLQLIAETPNLDWLLLTKRPGNIRGLLECSVANRPWVRDWLDGNPPSNIWLGTSIENQEQADRRIPELLKIPARVRFLSCEPLLGEVALTLKCPRDHNNDGDCDWHRNGCPRIHWVIAGGESGANARAMQVRWARSLRDQCIAAGVPFFFKQWGEWRPIGVGTDEHGTPPLRMGKKKAGRLLDGVEHNGMPRLI